MTVNFDTENIVLCVYPRFAGGKFLLNSLGLCDQAVFQDSVLAEKQLSGRFNCSDKLAYLLDMIEKNTLGKWNDLGLGCVQLFGSSERDYSDNIPPRNNIHGEQTSLYTVGNLTLNLKKIIEPLSNGELKFFLVVHDVLNLLPILDVWKNAKLIVFTNTANFNRLRNHSGKDTYQKVWDSEINSLIEKVGIQNKIFYFNNNNYFSEDDTIEEIRNLYNCLHLSDFNEQYIREYYKNWIKKCLPNELLKNS